MMTALAGRASFGCALLMPALFLSLPAMGRSAPEPLRLSLAIQDEAETSVASTQQLKDKDLEKLGKAFREYFDAKTESKGIFDALEEIDELIQKTEKRAERPLASMVADLERALHFADERKDKVPGKGQFDALELEGRWGDTIPYLFSAPKDYRVKTGPYPFVLIIPDAETGLEEQFRDEWATQAILDSAVVAMSGMPEDSASWTSFGSDGNPGGIANVLQVLREAKNAYSIDPNRVFLVGRGSGAAAAFEIASVYPYAFAGVAAMNGDIGETSPTNFAQLPSMFVAAASGATAFKERSDELGDGNVTLIPEGNTDTLLEWMNGLTRNANPAAFRFQPASDFSREAYWLRVDGFDLGSNPSLEAKVDRASNTITVTGDGFIQLDLRLNDSIVDLDKPVTVKINGETHEATFSRAIRTMLDRAYGSGDNGRLCTAMASFDFTPPEE